MRSCALTPGCVQGAICLDVLVGDEEESCAWGGPNDGGADAAVDAAEAACCGEASRGLETGLEGVEGVEGEVDCCACDGAGLE